MSARSTKAPASPEAEVAVGTVYTCPMHPEVRQVGPGHCPKCGMALEPFSSVSVIGNALRLRSAVD
jgi:hypothetical protein